MGCKGSKGTTQYKDKPEENSEDRRRRRLSVSKTTNEKGELPAEPKRSDGLEFSDSKEAGTIAVVQQLGEVLELFPNTERRFSLQGEHDKDRMQNFCDKKQTQTGDTPDGLAACCKKGLKPEAPNQDDFVLMQCGTGDAIFLMGGVFDGHGPHGHFVSNYVNRVLPGCVVRDRNLEKNPHRAIASAFRATQMGIQKQCVLEAFDATVSGTTATLAIVRKEGGQGKIHIGHCGDSRAIVGKGASWSSMTSMDLTEDHKPNLPEEQKRIEANGGVVKLRPGDVPHRVFKKGSGLPGLAMSRSFGDLFAASVGVSSEPTISSYDIGKDYKVMILCSDGVWEFMSGGDVIKQLKQFKPHELKKACGHIAQQAWNHWIKEEGNVVDDITVIGVDLEQFK